MKTCAYKRNPNVAWRELDGQFIIVTPQDSSLHQLNKTGTFLYRELEKSSLTNEQMVDRICKRYDTVKERALKDVDSFIKTLVKRGILLEV